VAYARHVRAFVLGGGGKWGAVHVGMLRALVAGGIEPQLVLGCSVGAMNGAAFAADPTLAGIDRLEAAWRATGDHPIVEATLAARVRSIVGQRPYVYDATALRDLIDSVVAVRRFDELTVPFECVASCIEDASEQWFGEGEITPAVLASCAIPGLLPPAEVDGRHYYDGGLVNSIPLDRAVAAGATTVYVLQVGRIESPLVPPKRLYEAPLLAFEIARRHRFATFQRHVPDRVAVHVLPSGNEIGMRDRRQLNWRRIDDATALIEGAHAATSDYLAGVTS
jgi:NTE family protein